MRLLNVETLNFEEFTGEIGDGIPVYAILSHTWGDEEVSYCDHLHQQSLFKKGYEKILGCCRLANSEGFQYVWIDTCCIDKSSSAELSEAINSMFQWYRDAGICYAYLNDVDSLEDPTRKDSSFAQSRWFTRGWTLQELLAPAELVFLGSDWVEIGTKKSLCTAVSRITRISEKVLDKGNWDDYSVAQKMSWAAGRKTTRVEDQAYCLMGLFDVNMPLLYGEGRKAFSRLQQEIMKESDDQSIFAWSFPEKWYSYTQMSGLLSPSAEFFKDASQIELLGPDQGEGYENPFQVVNRLVRLRLRLVDQIKALRLQHLQRDPVLYNVVEIQRSRETNKRKRSVSPQSSLSDSQQEPTICMENLDTSASDNLPTPTVTIEIQDTEPIAEELRASSKPLTEISGDSMSWEADQGTGGEIDAAAPRGDYFSLYTSIPLFDPEPDTTEIPDSWRWYIYEPAMLVPLRCHIGNRRLCILLSKSFDSAEGRILSRLHNPSIIATEGVQVDRLTPLTTVYASIFSRKINESPKSPPLNSPPIKLGFDPLFWPGVRITSVVAAGYSVHDDCGPGWEFHSSRGVLLQRRKSRYGRVKTGYAPLALFYRKSNGESTSLLARAFFMSLLGHSENKYICEIGVIMNDAASSTSWNYYSLDLTGERPAEVPLGDGKAIVVKYEKGSSIRFMEVSIKTLEEANAAIPVPHDMAKTIWLRSKILPMLESLI